MEAMPKWLHYTIAAFNCNPSRHEGIIVVFLCRFSTVDEWRQQPGPGNQIILLKTHNYVPVLRSINILKINLNMA